jgi:hypothetical protein
MSPLDNPEYQDEAQAIVVSVGNIVDAIKVHGMGTVSIMLILGELMNLSTVVNEFNTLPADQRDEFFAEVWDAAIGNEETALVTQVGIFSGEYLEAMSDGLKGAALSHFNSKVPLLPA